MTANELTAYLVLGHFLRPWTPDTLEEYPGNGTLPEDDDVTISSASLLTSPVVSTSSSAKHHSADLHTEDIAPMSTEGDVSSFSEEVIRNSSRPPRHLVNSQDTTARRSNNNCEILNGNVHVNVVSESISMDVLSGGESDAGDTLSRRNNNSISSAIGGTLRDWSGHEGGKRRGDILYLIAKELLMTERTYKRDLELVTVSFSSRVSSLGTTETATSEVYTLARACLALEPIALAQGALLARLEKGVSIAYTEGEKQEEPEYKKIDEILYEYLSDAYEAYSSYIANAGALVGMVESVRRLVLAVESSCAHLDSSAPLPLACLLLRPLHRLLYYPRIASACSYSRNVPGGDLLELADQLAREAEEELGHAENHASLCQLQRDIVGYDKLLVPNREFVRLGCVHKHSTKGLQQRMIFLFNDLLVVCAKCGSGQFRAQCALAMRTMHLRRDTAPPTLTLTDGETSITLSTSNEQEFSIWYQTLEETIENARQTTCIVDTELTPYEINTGSSCGGVGLAHVCWHRGTSLSKEHLHLATRTQLSGYLLRKFKNSHGWQKLWVVFAMFTLFFYKSWQDETALASLPLLGYSVGSPSPSDGIHKDFVFKLQFKNHVYFFRADSDYTYHRWTEVLRTAMILHQS